MIDWLIDSFIHGVSERGSGWLIGWLIDLLGEWVNGLLIDWVSGWVIDCQIFICSNTTTYLCFHYYLLQQMWFLKKV